MLKKNKLHPKVLCLTFGVQFKLFSKSTLRIKEVASFY